MHLLQKKSPPSIKDRKKLFKIQSSFEFDEFGLKTNDLIIVTKLENSEMYSGELEVQAKRKAIAVLQDEINRLVNASR